jgi:hypothetical protein
MRELLNEIMGYVLQGLAALISAMILVGLQRLAKRFNLQLSEREQAMVRGAVRKGIAGAEEWAARELKAHRQPVAGVQKAARVKSMVAAQWPKLLPEDLDRMLDEELAAMAGVGATGDRVVGAPPELAVVTTPLTPGE